MNRFLHLSIIAAALCTTASATMVTMSSNATFTGGLDMALNTGATDDQTTRILSGLFAPAVTDDLTVVGQEDRLLLGTLIINENIAQGDTTPNILDQESNGGYQLNISVPTVEWGILNFIAQGPMFNLNGFNPGPASDANTTDGPEEIVIDYSTVFSDVTVGLMTVRFSIVDDEFGNSQFLNLNQGSTAETVYLRAQVLRIDEPQVGDVPEPASMALMGTGLLGLGLVARKRSSRA